MLLGLSAAIQTDAQETQPDPALLEMLGAIGDIENLGVNVDNMIGQQLDIKDEEETREAQQ